MAPTIYYFPIKGRAEVMKLVMALAGTDFELVQTPRTAEGVSDCKDLEQFPFGQVPRYKDDQVDLAQSNAIIRYLGRKHNLAGADLAQMAAVDMILDAVEDLRNVYVPMIYQDRLSAEATAAFWAKHIDAEGMNGRNGGVNLGYLTRLIKKNGGKFFVGSSLTVADLAFYDMIDNLVNVYGADKIAALHPELIALHAAVVATPSISAYLTGPKRMVNANANGLGNAK